jgi:uroporphyrinogen-III decarboxylase
MLMMFAARQHGVKYIDYTRDRRLVADAQLHTARDFGTDVLLTCTDPACEVIDICGDRHIVNAGCEIPPVAPDENARALIRYAREHRPEEVATV